MSNVKL